MNDSISRDEFNAHFGVIQTGLAETSREVRDLAKSVNSYVQTSTRLEERINNSIDKTESVVIGLEKFKDNVTPRIRTLETARSNNLLRWAFLVSVVTVIIGLATWAYTTFSKPQADVRTAIENQSIMMEQLINITETTSNNISSITTTMDENYNAVKAKKIAEENHGIKLDE